MGAESLERPWVYNLLYQLNCNTCGPESPLLIDSAGDLYGAAIQGGAYGYGFVFKLVPSNGSWSLIHLHDFTYLDGAGPYGYLVFDSSGNLYGTTLNGGTGSGCNSGCGVVWKITLN